MTTSTTTLALLTQDLTRAFKTIDGNNREAAAQMIAAAGLMDDADDYDAIEIEAVGVYADPTSAPGHTICIPIVAGDKWQPDCLAVIFTVYAHLKSGGVEMVADFTTRPLAEEFAPLIAAAIGVEVEA